MTFDVVVFKAIDYIYDLLQNRIGAMRKYKKLTKVQKDIVYDETNPDICKLDIYENKVETSNKKPVVFIIHGGGFVAGDKKYRRHLSSWYAIETGAFVVNVNYGLGPKYLFPEVMSHLTKAVNWVYDNADKYNLDLSKVVCTGDSAGGYYAAELCALQDSKDMQEKLNCFPKLKFTGLLLNCGIYDINRALSTKVLFNLTGLVCKSFSGVDIKDIRNYEYFDYVSPINHLTKNFPKSCVVYAAQDFFCGGQGEDFLKKLNELGIYNEEYHSSKFMDNHTFPSTWKSKAAKEANSLFLSFTKRLFNNEI